MEITQFTYFQQVGGIDLDADQRSSSPTASSASPCTCRASDSVYDIEWAPGVTYGDVYQENERQWCQATTSRSPTPRPAARHFDEYEVECRRCLDAGCRSPAYDYVLKCSHAFNLLDARGAISVTERGQYIWRVRALAARCARAHLESRVPEPEAVRA